MKIRFTACGMQSARPGEILQPENGYAQGFRNFALARVLFARSMFFDKISISRLRRRYATIRRTRRATRSMRQRRQLLETCHGICIRIREWNLTCQDSSSVKKIQLCAGHLRIESCRQVGAQIGKAIFFQPSNLTVASIRSVSSGPPRGNMVDGLPRAHKFCSPRTIGFKIFQMTRRTCPSSKNNTATQEIAIRKLVKNLYFSIRKIEISQNL